MTKKYTTCFTEAQIRAAIVGADFFDHGRHMMITAVGKPYWDGNQKVFDIEAVMLADVKKRSPSRGIAKRAAGDIRLVADLNKDTSFKE